MKRIILGGLLLALTAHVAASPITIKPEVAKPAKKAVKRPAKRLVHVYSSAFEAGESWCFTSGGLHYVEIDPNQKNGKTVLFRYICKKRLK